MRARTRRCAACASEREGEKGEARAASPRLTFCSPVPSSPQIIAYAAMDIAAKCVFGFVLVASHASIEQYEAPASEAAYAAPKLTSA